VTAGHGEATASNRSKQPKRIGERPVMFQQMGYGIAIALLIDATLIRSVLVPAAMQLLGERNWYLSGWLQWLPHVDVEGHAEQAAGGAAPATQPK
jgi:uncharacterized membrane protein YdfJ with MMPL/SSD domain